MAKSWINAFRRAASQAGYNLEQTQNHTATNSSVSGTSSGSLDQLPPENVEDYLQVLRSDDWFARHKALEVLAIHTQKGDSRAIAVAEAHLNDPRMEVRALARKIVDTVKVK